MGNSLTIGQRLALNRLKQRLGLKLKAMLIIALIVGLIILGLSSCADVTDIQKCAQDTPYGFWGGLWHGIISPFSFFGSLFSDDITMYAVNNNGGWYDFGFVLGAGILFGGGSSSKKK